MQQIWNWSLGVIPSAVGRRNSCTKPRRSCLTLLMCMLATGIPHHVASGELNSALANAPTDVTLQSRQRLNCSTNVADLPNARNALVRVPLTKPTLGQSVVDPAHGTCIRRLTDHLAAGNNSYLRTNYSRSEAFNANNTRVLALADNGAWHLIDTATSRDLGELAGLVGDAEPQWHRTDPNRLYYFPDNGGLSIHALNIANGQISDIADFTNRLPWQVRRRLISVGGVCLLRPPTSMHWA